MSDLTSQGFRFGPGAARTEYSRIQSSFPHAARGSLMLTLVLVWALRLASCKAVCASTWKYVSPYVMQTRQLKTAASAKRGRGTYGGYF